MITVEYKGGPELARRFKNANDPVRREFVKTTYALALKLESHVKLTKLMGQVLNHRSGRLLQSIQNRVNTTSTGVTGEVFSSGDVKYAAIHEYGGVTAPHRIESNGAHPLAFVMGGRTVFANYVNHPGSKMPERSYMRSSLADMRAEILDGYEAAFMRGIAAK